MKTLLKKSICFLLAFFMAAGFRFTDPRSAAAEIKYIYNPTEVKTAYAGTPIQQDFTLSKASETGILINTASPVAVSISLYNSSNTLIQKFQITASDSHWESSEYGYINGVSYPLTAGDYSVEVTFDTAASYRLFIAANEPDAAISNETLTITAGFSKTLKITNNTGKAKWKSSKTSIATVNSSGKVTAKKAGKCTITATVDGKNLKCTVTVKNNKYSETPLTNSQAKQNVATVDTYHASYDSKGNLVVKCRLINNMGYNSDYMESVNIVLKTAEGKTIGTYKASRITMSVPNQSYKNFSVTIKKADLKIKKADLRNAKITITGNIYGRKSY